MSWAIHYVRSGSAHLQPAPDWRSCLAYQFGVGGSGEPHAGFRVPERSGAYESNHCERVVDCGLRHFAHVLVFFAERPQAHALNALFTAALVYGALTWRGSLKHYFLCCYLFGLGLTNHLLLAFALPGIALLFYARARRFQIKPAWLVMGIVPAGIGLLPYWLLAAVQGNVGRSLSVINLAQQLFTLQTPARDAALWIAFLGYNFVGVAVLLCVLGAVRLWRGQRATLGGILLIYVTSAWFVFDSQLPDQYKYYIPSYLALSLLVGPGYLVVEQWLRGRNEPVRLAAMLLPALMSIPMLTYHFAPQVLHSAGVSTLLDVRNLPYRDALDYYLQPSRRGR